MLPRNRDVLSQRWPDLLARLERAPALADVARVDERVPTLAVGGIRLTSARDRAGEAREQSALIPAGAERAWVYGLGLGDLPRLLLGRPALRELGVVLLNASLARECLARFDQADWLAEPRVRLLWGGDERDVRAPFAALPGELALAAPECARLRDLVQLELAAPWAAERLAEREQHFAAAIARNRARVAADGGVEELFGAWEERTVLVAGAGPTLADALPELARREHPLVAVDGALRALLAAGVVPDVVVSVDSHEVGVPRLFETDLAALAGATLVYFPVVPAVVLERFPGRRLVAYGDHARWAELAAAHPHGRLWVSGSVTHAAVDLAVKGGARRVVLLGCDFGFAHGLTHVAGNPYSRPAAEAGVPGAWVEDVRGGRLPSLPNLCGYLRDLERYVRAHPEVRFRNASTAGAAIQGAPAPEEGAALGR